MTTAAFPQPTTSTRAAAPPRAESLQGRGRWGTREWTMLRWAVRATLFLGVAASVAANVLHAQPNPISQAIAAWPPLALLFTVELIARVPVHRRGLAAARLLAATTIAGIAAFVSYWHMVGVAARYGETGASPYLLPLSVDGLIIVASISLVEISGRLRTTRPPADPAPATSSPPSATPAVWASIGEGTHEATALHEPAGPPPAGLSTSTAPASSLVPPGQPAAQRTGPSAKNPNSAAPPRSKPACADEAVNELPPPAVRPVPAGLAPERPLADDADHPHRGPTGPRDAIAYWRQRQPDIGVDELAHRIGRSPRQIRRYLGH